MVVQVVLVATDLSERKNTFELEQISISQSVIQNTQLSPYMPDTDLSNLYSLVIHLVLEMRCKTED